MGLNGSIEGSNPSFSASAAPAAVLRPPAEGWQSGRMRRSRKPLSVVRRIEGSNPSPSALHAESDAGDRVRGPRRCSGLGRTTHRDLPGPADARSDRRATGARRGERVDGKRRRKHVFRRGSSRPRLSTWPAAGAPLRGYDGPPSTGQGRRAGLALAAQGSLRRTGPAELALFTLRPRGVSARILSTTFLSQTRRTRSVR
jgi:hypothetical protein